MGYATFIKIHGDKVVEAKLTRDVILDAMEEFDVVVPTDDQERRIFLGGIENILEAIQNSEFSLGMECGNIDDEAIQQTLNILEKMGIIEYICNNDEIYAETHMFAGVKV